MQQTDTVVWQDYESSIPPECCHYLVTIKFPQVARPEIRMAYWGNSGWVGIGGLVTSPTVVAWAHLPKAFEKKEVA